MRKWLGCAGFGLIATFLSTVAMASESGGAAHEGPKLGEILPIWSVLPFVGLLLSIAIVPMTAGHFWEHRKNQLMVALGWASPVFAFLVYLTLSDHLGLGHEAWHALKHAVLEYISFIILLAALYIIAGGVLLRGDLRGTPLVNTLFLAIGSVLANVFGTTGASMLLIRPMLRTNADREHSWHIPVFFIFIVSNVGGALTPIGDPPLFLGYLRGIDFWWTLTSMWHIWVPTVLALLAIFYVVDTIQVRKETKRAETADKLHVEPLGIEGYRNFALLAGVIGSVLFLSPDPHHPDFRDYYAREICMVALSALSVWITPRVIREKNGFNFGPILEVASLFAGIFIVMIPATTLLTTYGDQLGVTRPWQYFWAAGSLSAFLDNAPTYITFAAMACGTFKTCTDTDLGPLSTNPDSIPVLIAISLGAVFCGAGSYIGNGPNFMVRAIAEQAKYKMPSFFGYCGLALVFLGPVYAAVTLIWLR